METMTAAGAPWLGRASHRHALFGQARQLLDFHRQGIDARGRFVDLDDDGRPLDPAAPQQLFVVARAVHCYALGELLGVPGCAAIVERGLDALRREHHDPANGGFVETVGDAGVLDGTKAAYGHAFVLLAASSAALAGHESDDLFDEALKTIDDHFWSAEDGASREGFTREWDELEPYRGANSNMHLCEALLAASDARQRADLAARAESIARLLIDRHARAHEWMLPEHYDASWQARPEYNKDRLDDRFRPYGVTIGHLLEWSRLLCCVAEATNGRGSWLSEAAVALFGTAVAVGWDTERGGLAYTVDFDGGRANPHRYWWPVAEGIAASAVLGQLTGDGRYELWYRRLWEFAGEHFMDHQRGGWYAQLDENNRRTASPWYGKPDLYHVLQACLIPLLPPAASVAGALAHAPLAL